MRLHEIDPAFHTVILIFQHPRVAVHQIHRPRVDHRRIRPRRCGVRPAAGQQTIILAVAVENIRDHMRNTALRCLVTAQISQPFGKEITRLHQVAGGPAEDLRITRPAQTLVALRAVGRHIDKVTFQPPEDIVVQLVKILIRTTEMACLLHGGMQHDGGEIVQSHLSRIFFDFHVAKALPGEMRMINFLAIAFERIFHPLFGRA